MRVIANFSNRLRAELECFVAQASHEQWIWADVETLRVTRNIGFTQGVVRNAAGEVLMRASGSYKLPKNIEKASGILIEDLMAMGGL